MSSLREYVLTGFSIAVAALLIGCDSPNRVTGTLTAYSTIRVNTAGGNQQAISPGAYKAVIRMEKSGGQISISNGARNINFKIPQTSGTEQANIRVSASSLGQEFGLSGRIYQSQYSFDRVVERACIYDLQRDYHCYRTKRGDRVCDWIDREIPGRQQVREVGFSTNKNINIDLINTSGRKIGNFLGVYSYGNTLTQENYLTGCRRWGF